MKDVRGLVDKAKAENLNQSDIAFVAKQIEACKDSPNDDLYDYIYILGRGMFGKPIPLEYRKLVEYFLYHPQDTFTAGLALNVLCKYWNFSSEYLDALKLFIRGVSWDDLGEVRGEAIVNAGYFLRDNFDKELLSLVIDVFEKSDTSDEVQDFSRLLAYSALGWAQGLDWPELPPYSARFSDLEQRGLVDLSIVERARQMVKNS